MNSLQSVHGSSQTNTVSTCGTEIVETTLQGRKAVVLQNDFLRATVLPQIGGKLASLVNLASGREFLLQPPGGQYAHPVYGGAFDAHEASGFDECFPTVAACKYPDAPFAEVLLPDHGELWSIPWKADLCGGTLRVAASGIRLPYLLRKKFMLDGSILRIDYELASVSDLPIVYLYSAHPLLNVEAGASIVLPPEISTMYVHSSSDEQLGRHGEHCSWPVAAVKGAEIRLDTLIGPEVASAHKLFTPRISTGSCGIHFPRTREALLYRFDPQALPYIGLWLCQGAWPSAKNGQFAAALEPCSGRPDALDEAFSRGEHRTLPALGIHRWSMEMNILSNCESLTLQS